MMVLVCVDDYDSIKEGFGNCYYYIYTYEQPKLHRLAPIQTSNRRDVIYYTRIQGQGYSYSGRTELDSHADKTVAGRNCMVMQCCTLLRHVQAHDKHTDYHGSNGIHIHNMEKIHIGLQ